MHVLINEYVCITSTKCILHMYVKVGTKKACMQTKCYSISNVFHECGHNDIPFLLYSMYVDTLVFQRIDKH
jgi:hypothetical protein